MRPPRFTLAALLLLGLAPQGGAQSTIYSWQDEKGVTHFSNSAVPPEHAARARRRVFLEHKPAPGSANSPETGIDVIRGEGRRYVRATLEGQAGSREVMMVVDTGAEITVIGEDIARELDVEFQRQAALLGVTGAARGWIGRLRRLRIGDRELVDWPVMVGPVPGTALLGLDVLDKLDLTVGRDRLH